MSSVSRLAVALVLGLAACSSDPVAQPPITRDSGPGLDAQLTHDDAFSSDDAATVALPDAADPLADAGETPDAADPGTNPDATAPDAMVVGPPPDADGDTISDATEGTADTDGDGTLDSADADSDDDGIPDATEAGDTDVATPPIDTDGDGTPDYRDADSDDDGIPDLIEGTADTDGDMIPNARDADSDGDGIPDLVEGTGDPDGDTTPNYLDTDSDGDTIGDTLEGTGDPDGDLMPNYLDAESDGDGIADQLEGAGDLDGDGLKNFLDLDADGDMIADATEGSGDLDGDRIPSFLDVDSDGDGITDAIEAGDTDVLTAPLDGDFDGTPSYLDLDSDADFISDRDEGLVDTDGDMTPDYLDIDSDADGLLDQVEAGDIDLLTAPASSDADGTADFRDTDSDGDTIVDAAESTADRDGDMIPNYRDTDSDNDGVSDAIEAGDADPLTRPINSDTDQQPDYLDTDSDDDGLADSTEAGCPAASSRLLADSDGDGFPDPAERAFGSNPCSMASVIDGFYFVLPPLDPLQRAPLVFSDTDIDRADITFDVDTTGSMGEEATNLRSSLSTTIIPGVDARIPDAAFGVAFFDDYPVTPFGAAGDSPWALLQRVTTDAAAAQAGVNALVIHDGVDLPENGLGALYHVATGAAVSFPGGAVPAFDPSAGRVVGVADGIIGGVGMREDAFPVIVHITDATAHQRPDYQAVNGAIAAPDTNTVFTALDAIGARVVGIASERLPSGIHSAICTHGTAQILGDIREPAGSDVDYYELVGATAGQSVTVRTTARGAASSLDTMIGVLNSTGIIGSNDDISTTNFDSQLTIALSGAAPYYVAVTSYDDPDFNASGAQTTGHYLLDVSVAGTAFTTQTTQCRADDPNARLNATRLVAFASATAPANTAQCLTDCDGVLPRLSLPYGIAERTGAVIPTCAWDRFGGSRPAGCAANQCCTGVNGAGVAANAAGQCPLSFQITDNGAGLSNAVVTGIEALVRFSAFTVTTQVRADPVELMATGFDTTCFIHGVVPISATPQPCAPTPRIVDLIPPAGINDSFENVAPGTTLSFDVNAQNLNLANSMACRPRTASPQLFRAYIDVIADGVTVVDTRDVIIIVPPEPPGGSN